MNLNLKNINKKIVIIFSLIGFLLGFISGLVSRSSFINLMFHSIISGIVIGIIIIIINIVVMIYLPELLEKGDNDDEDVSDADEHVNIVMPEEKYNVQNSDVDEVLTEDDISENVENTPESSFKEVDLDHLSNLSTSTIRNELVDSDNTEIISDELPSMSSDIKGDSNIENHSIEDMTKAVQTILKKD